MPGILVHSSSRSSIFRLLDVRFALPFLFVADERSFAVELGAVGVDAVSDAAVRTMAPLTRTSLERRCVVKFEQGLSLTIIPVRLIASIAIRV
jgi:hypothetical protein